VVLDIDHRAFSTASISPPPAAMNASDDPPLLLWKELPEVVRSAVDPLWNRSASHSNVGVWGSILTEIIVMSRPIRSPQDANPFELWNRGASSSGTGGEKQSTPSPGPIETAPELADHGAATATDQLRTLLALLDADADRVADETIVAIDETHAVAATAAAAAAIVAERGGDGGGETESRALIALVMPITSFVKDCVTCPKYAQTDVDKLLLFTVRLFSSFLLCCDMLAPPHKGF
jgi:hypothetical protein